MEILIRDEKLRTLILVGPFRVGEFADGERVLNRWGVDMGEFVSGGTAAELVGWLNGR